MPVSKVPKKRGADPRIEHYLELGTLLKAALDESEEHSKRVRRAADMIMDLIESDYVQPPKKLRDLYNSMSVLLSPG